MSRLATDENETNRANEANRMNMANEFICVVCPLGCILKIQGEDISGHTCNRGLLYAQKEQTDPRRSISGTVRIVGAMQNALPVKTSEPIPKGQLLDAAALLRTITVYSPIRSGDVIVSDILGTGVDFVATLSMGRVDS